MKPIVVAYPRTGSEIITEIIFNYAKQFFGSERCLKEFLLITFFRNSNYSFEDNKILGDYWSLPKEQWYDQWNKVKNNLHEIAQDRIEWLKINPNYVFKLIITPRLTDDQYQWCLDNFNPIFVERKDNLRSFLSFLFLPNIGTHHLISSNIIKKENTKVKFDKVLANTWIWDYQKYKQLLLKSNNKMQIIYEDICTNGNVDEIKVFTSLGWEIPTNYIKYNFTTKPTPYEDENLLEYFEDKKQVVNFIAQFPEIFDKKYL